MLFPKAAKSALMLLALSHFGPDSRALIAGTLDPAASGGVAKQPPPPESPAPLDSNFNGIVAGEPKIYDDGSLDRMLRDYESQLAQLKAFDNPTLLTRIGTLQGANSQQSSFAAQATGRPTPDLTSTVTTGGTNAGTQTVNKQASITPAVPGITDSGASALPNSFSTSASDALGEEAQLAFEIANLRLLLQESLSDRYISGTSLNKRSVTIGIPISIEPIKGSEGAVAEIEISFTSAAALPASSYSSSPGVITLLPREKTYNVAAIKDSSVSLGAGAVISNVINVGINWMGRKQSYYIVKDIDTVAMQRATQQSATTVLAWQFRPVMGEKTVRPGLRQAFVRLSFPVVGVSNDLGTVWIKTTWRHYDQKSGVVGSPKCTKVWSGRYPLSDVGRFVEGILSWSDLGTGQVSVVESGSFPPGTSVLLPEGYLSDGSPNFALDSKHLLFNLSSAQLVRARVGSLVSIFGNESELKTDCSPGLPNAMAKISGVDIKPYNATQSMVIVKLEDGDVTEYQKDPPLVLLGKHVFGLGDAPFYEVQAEFVTKKGDASAQNSDFKKWEALSFLSTNDDLRQVHNLAIAHPFCGSKFYDTVPFRFSDDFIASQATTLSTGESGSVIAISGQNLTSVRVLVNGISAQQAVTQAPDRPIQLAKHAALTGRLKSRGSSLQKIALTPTPCDPPTLDQTYAPTMLLLHVPNCLAAGLKSIAVAAFPKGETTVLALDTGDPKPLIKQPDPIPQLAAGARKLLKLTGSNLGMVQDVQFKGNSLQPEIAADKSYISIVLPDEIGTVPGLYLLIAAANDKAKTQIPVVVTIAAAPKPGT